MDEIVKGLKIGAGVLVVVVVAGLCWLAYDTRQAALEGRAAMQFIRDVNTPKPAAAPPASTPPAAPAEKK